MAKSGQGRQEEKFVRGSEMDWHDIYIKVTDKTRENLTKN
jgi:hypothetical protein